MASRRRSTRSVRQSLVSSMAERTRWPWCLSSLASKRSNSVKASAVAPAKPASTLPWCSLRTLRAVPLTTMARGVTWPPPPMATCTPWGVWRRTLKMVVPGNTGWFCNESMTAANGNGPAFCLGAQHPPESPAAPGSASGLAKPAPQRPWLGPCVARVVENGCPVSPGRRADGAGGSIFSGYHPGMRVDADHVEENRHQPLQVAELNHMAAGLLLGRPVEHRAGRPKVHANELVAGDRERHPGAHELLHRLEQMRGVAIDMTAEPGHGRVVAVLRCRGSAACGLHVQRLLQGAVRRLRRCAGGHALVVGVSAA